MKFPLPLVFISICALLPLLSGCKKDKEKGAITFAEPAWDSLTRPLQMQAYYVTVSTRQKTAQLSLRIDVYMNGEAIQRSGGTIIHFQELQPIEFSNAIYFDKSNDAQWGTIVSAFGRDRGDIGTSRFKLDVPSRELASLKPYRFNEPVNPNGITPLFAVAYGATSFIGGGNLKTVLSYHKDVPVIVFSLEASQEIKAFKSVSEQPLPTIADEH